MKKLIILTFLLISDLTAFGQSDIKIISKPEKVIKQRATNEPIKQYDSFFEAARALKSKKSNSDLGSLMIPTVRGYNTGYGESSYDKNFNWNADASDDIQGSLKKHHDEREREAGMNVQNIAFSILFFIALLIIGILAFNSKPKEVVEYKRTQQNQIPRKTFMDNDL